MAVLRSLPKYNIVALVIKRHYDIIQMNSETGMSTLIPKTCYRNITAISADGGERKKTNFLP